MNVKILSLETTKTSKGQNYTKIVVSSPKPVVYATAAPSKANKK